MSDKPENPPAFPTHWQDDTPGMTLRDWFAGQALAGIMANTEYAKSMKEAAGIMKRAPDQVISGMAFEAADAMLRERSK